MPNIPTNPAITYTNPFHPSVFPLAGLEIWFRSAKLNKNYLTSYPDITIGTSRSKGVTATRMSLKSLYSDYSYPLTSSIVGEPS